MKSAAVSAAMPDLPKTMLAATNDRYGPLELVRVQTEPVPEPGKGQVLVRVHAAAINPADIFAVTGSPKATRLVTGLVRPRQSIFGHDMAGIVVSVGGGVTGFAVGERVFGEGVGTFAEYCVASTKRIAALSARWTFADAAAVPMAGTTALQLLRRSLPEAAGRRLLVIGAGGGIGTFLVQLAAAGGAEVVAVCSAAKREIVLGLGAAEVVDYATHDITTHVGRYDAIVDNVAALRFNELTPLLAPGGLLVTNSGTGTANGGALRRPLSAALLHTFLRRPVVAAVASVRPADLDYLASLGATGRLRSVIGSRHPLAGITSALTEVAGGHALGKVVIDISPDDHDS